MPSPCPTPPDVTRPYAVNGLNQYRQAGPATFDYDANGNLIRSTPPAPDGPTNYTYDVENRLVAASGAHNAQLRYDPLGRLWQVSSALGITRLLYDGDALVAEYDAAGAIQKRYAHWVGADVPMVEYIGASTAVPRQLFPNHLGSIVAATGAGGAMLYANRYDEWGIPHQDNQGRFQYTGQIWIPELGLYYYKARFLSPTLGRFLQTDPVGYDDQINLYAYVANDPINLTDPDGMYICGSCSGFSSDGVLGDRDRRDMSGPKMFDGGAGNGGGAGGGDPPGSGHNQGPLLDDDNGVDIVSIGGAVMRRAGGAIVLLVTPSAAIGPPPGPGTLGDAVREFAARTGWSSQRVGQIVGWGGARGGEADVIARTQAITPQAVQVMRNQGLTREVVVFWRNHYVRVFGMGRGVGRGASHGGVGAARARHMQTILDNW